MTDLRQLQLKDKRIIALCRQIRPGSVRDSIYRAEQFCEQIAKDAKLLASEGHVLVVGAGPVGLAAVAKMLDLGYRVVSCNAPVSKADETLSRCRHRIICPTTYDFPAEHYTVRKYPHRADLPTLLPWRFSQANRVYAQLTRTVRRKIQETQSRSEVDEVRHSHLENTFLADVDESDPSVLKITLNIDGVEDEPRDVNLILLCTGPGQTSAELRGEKGNYLSHGWWSNRDAVLIKPSLAAGQRVLIWGSGDGGLADFVRLLTGIIDPFDALKALSLPSTAVEALYEIHKAMWRSYNAGQPDSDHAVLITAQAKSVAIIDELWENDSDLRHNVLNHILLPPERRPAVQLAFRCWHFTWSYFANRVVAQVLARALASDSKSNQGIAPFLAGVDHLGHEGPAPHSCGKKIEDCIAIEHEVRFTRRVCDGVSETEIPELITTHRMDPKKLPSPAGEAWKKTTSIEVVSAGFDRLIPRFGPGPSSSQLPKHLLRQVELFRKEPIRDVLPFYLGE